MNKEQFITERTQIISDMLDNPDECGIYPTTKCFEELDALYDTITASGTAEVKKEHDSFDMQPCCQDNEWLCSVCGKSARYY